MGRAVKISPLRKMLAFDYFIIAVALLCIALSRSTHADVPQRHGSVVPHETHTSSVALE